MQQQVGVSVSLFGCVRAYVCQCMSLFLTLFLCAVCGLLCESYIGDGEGKDCMYYYSASDYAFIEDIILSVSIISETGVPICSRSTKSNAP